MPVDRVRILQWSDLVVEIEAGAEPFGSPVFVMENGEEDEEFVDRYESLGAAFQAESGLTLTPDTIITLLGPLAGLATGDWPFPEGLVIADPDSWALTSWDEAHWDGDWRVEVNGNEVKVDLDAFPFGPDAAEDGEPPGAGDVLTIEVPDYEGVGCSFYIDEWGCGWVYVFTVWKTFLGPADPTDPVATIETHIDGRTFGQVASISTQLLDDGGMRAALGQLGATGLVELTDDTELILQSGSTTVGEFLEK